MTDDTKETRQDLPLESGQDPSCGQDLKLGLLRFLAKLDPEGPQKRGEDHGSA